MSKISLFVIILLASKTLAFVSNVPSIPSFYEVFGTSKC